MATLKPRTPEKPGPAASGKAANGHALRFQYSDILHKQVLGAIRRIEEAEDPTDHRDALAEVVVALMIRGLDAYFMEPLKEARAGFIVQKSAQLGLTGAQQVIGSVIGKIIGRMDGPQLLSVCGSIRRFMV